MVICYSSNRTLMQDPRDRPGLPSFSDPEVNFKSRVLPAHVCSLAPPYPNCPIGGHRGGGSAMLTSNNNLTLTECASYARDHLKHLTCVICANGHNCATGKVVSFPSFSQVRDWGIKKLSNLPKVVWILSCWVKIWTPTSLRGIWENETSLAYSVGRIMDMFSLL